MSIKNKFKKRGNSGCSKRTEYRLYDSIKHVGLLQPLVFTKKSDTQQCELYGGGHTRLKLLNAVQLEQKGNGLEPVPANFVLRTQSISGDQLKLSHLIQNHVRKRSKFIDKALHLNDCIETRENEITQKMSQREIVMWLRKSGFPISQSLLNDMRFVARELYPLLPKALNKGMGRRHIVNVRKLYRAMRDIWKYFGEELSDCFEAFEDICEECDDDTLDIHLFREVMEREICLWCDVDSQYVRAMLLCSNEERARLIKCLAARNRKKPPSPRSQAPISKTRATRPLQEVPTSKFAPILYDLPPAVINRRKRYARCLALDLAGKADLVDCISGSMTNVLGYSVLNSPSATPAGATSVWQILYYCQQAVQAQTINCQRVRWGWQWLDQTQFAALCSLLEVTRSLSLARRSPESFLKRAA